MKFLIDTNVFIPLEPTNLTEVEPGTGPAAELAQLVSRTGSQLYVHPAQREDIRRDTDRDRRRLREALFAKYPELQNPPLITSALESFLGSPPIGSNDWVDHNLVAALHGNAVDYLVTEDVKLQKKAERCGLADRVATVSEARNIVQSLFVDLVPSPPPAVVGLKAYGLNECDPIFNSLRADYPDFDQWMKKCKLEHRDSWVIMASRSAYAAVCVVKKEQPGEYGLAGKVLKISTFKVSESHVGLRFGELLLKAAFRFADSNRYDWIFVEVFDKHPRPIGFFREFGFEDVGTKSKRGELVLAKPMSFTEDERTRLAPLPFHIRYGPFAAKFADVPTFVVPIRPEFHRLLFPEAEPQQGFFAGSFAPGNSLRKAYLSNASARNIPLGSNLLFYLSETRRAITTHGVVEGILVSSFPVELARYVGKRTVYIFGQIERLCQKKVLAILFRQARVLRHPIPLSEMMAECVVKAPPQSIVKVPAEAAIWLQSRIGR